MIFDDEELGLCQPWYDKLSGLIVEPTHVVTGDDIAKAIRLGHAFIMEFVRRASFHGMTPEHLLSLPSALGASDGGLVFAWREGTTVLGFLQAGVIARGPLGHRVVHLLEADGSIREILGRAKQEALDAFDLEREAVHRSVAA